MGMQNSDIKLKMLHLIKENRMNKYSFYYLVLLVSIISSCKSIKIDSITDYTPSLIEKSLNNTFIIINDESIIPDNVLKAINKSRKYPVKYKFGKQEEDINAHFMSENKLANQRIIQAGKSNKGVIIILYDTASAAGIIRRFLIIKKIDTHLYKIYDDCVSPKVERIEDLKIKSNRCH